MISPPLPEATILERRLKLSQISSTPLLLARARQRLLQICRVRIDEKLKSGQADDAVLFRWTNSLDEVKTVHVKSVLEFLLSRSGAHDMLNFLTSKYGLALDELEELRRVNGDQQVVTNVVLDTGASKRVFVIRRIVLYL